MREKTQGSSDKEFSYLLRRHKLDIPLVRFEGTKTEFTIKYKNTIKSSVVPSKSTKCKGKSSGRMKTKSSMSRGGEGGSDEFLTAQPLPIPVAKVKKTAMGKEVKKYDYKSNVKSQRQVLDNLSSLCNSRELLKSKQLYMEEKQIEAGNSAQSEKKYRKLYKKMCNLTNELVKK